MLTLLMLECVGSEVSVRKPKVVRSPYEGLLDFAVIFDLDGVIADTNWAHQQAIRVFCGRYGFALSDEELKARVFGRRNSEWIREFFGLDLSAVDIDRLSREKEALFREIYAPHIVPLRGLRQFLDMLRSRCIAMAVATSAPAANAELILYKTGLAHQFGVVLDEASVCAGKPNPAIYLRTAKELGVAPTRCVIFEDSLPGIEAARRSGGKVVGITTTHGIDELRRAADLVIRDFVGLTLSGLESLVNGKNCLEV